MAKLIVENGAEAGAAFELNAPEMVIGRQTGVEIKLNGTNVSRRHARVLREGARFFLEDLNSSNGTFLNGSKLADRASLKPRDEVRIGPYVLRFVPAVNEGPEVTIRARTVADTANPDLYKENAAHKLRIILKLSNDLSRTLELEKLLPEILNHLFGLFPNAERGLMILFEAGRAVVRACRNRDGTEAPPQYSNSVLQKVLSEKVALIAEDLQTDRRFAEAESICWLGLRSLICVPLQTKTGTIFGVVQLERKGTGNRFTTEDLHFLTALGLQISGALENAQLHQELLQKQRIEREVAMAREIQLGYLPKQVPEMATCDFDLHAELSPAHEISGDFYDYFKLGDERLAIAVADVSGKGVPAAIFMSMVRALLRNIASPRKNAGEILRDLNDALARENPNCLFVTLALAVFEPCSGQLQLASGGHPPALLRRVDGSVEALHAAKGPLLGFEPLSFPFPNLNLRLEKGETLLLYTDGITEAPSENMEMFGLPRLERCVRAWEASKGLKVCAESIRSEVAAFTRNTAQEDDITLALLRRL